MRKLLVICLVCLVSLGSLVGCSSGKKASETKVITQLTEKVTITIWHTYSEHHQEALNKIIADFNASQDMITVVAQAQPYQDFSSKLIQAVRNGTGPDIVSAYATDAADYHNEDLLVDFAPYINNDEIGISNFEDNLVGNLYGEITQWGTDSIYMIPSIVTSEVLFYNKTWFDELGIEVPTTWEEVETYSKKIKEAKGVPGFGSDSIIDTYQDLIKQAGSEYIDPDTKTVKFNNDIGLNKLTWLTDNIKAGNFRLVGEDMYFSNPFGSEAVGSYVGSSAGISFVQAAAGDKFEVGVAPIPQDGKVKYVPSWGGDYICFKSTDEKALASYEFLKYFISKDVNAEWAIEFGAAPAHKDALETDAYQEYCHTNPAAKALYEELDCVNWLSGIVGSESVRTAIDKMVQDVALNDVDPQDALDECEKTSNAALQQ